MKIKVGNNEANIPVSIEFCCSSMSLEVLAHSSHISSGMWYTRGRANHFCPFCGRKVEIIIDEDTEK